MLFRKTFIAPGRAALLATPLLLLASCGHGGGSTGGTGVDYQYTVNLTPDKTTVAPGGTVNLSPQVDAPSGSQTLNWKITCSQTDCGAVSAAGVFTAPAAVTEQMLMSVTATVAASPTHSYSVSIWVTGKIVVRLTPDWTIALVTGTTQQFSATVNSPDTQIIWQVNGITGGNSTIGTVSTGGLYTAPAQVPNPDTVAVAAVAHADQTASASKQVLITPPPPIVVAISPRNQTVATGATLQFSASVTNTTDTAVVWRVNNVAGGNSTVGTVSTAGLYTAPASVPSPATVTLSAYSHADASKFDSTSITISGSNNAKLSGPYAFLLNGPGMLGSGAGAQQSAMVAKIGALVSDGSGNVTGLMDFNSVSVSAATKAIPFTGVYNIGVDNRGVIALNFPVPAIYAFTINSAGTNAKLIEFDLTNGREVGFLEKQTTTDFSLAKLTGNYAFAASGSAGGSHRVTVVGNFHGDGLGALSAASLDLKAYNEALVSLANLAGTAAMANATYGRGTLTLVESSTESVNASFYMVNAGELLIMTTDPVTSDVPLLVGRILGQTGSPFSSSSLSGASAFSLAGVATNNSAATYSTLGQWSANSATLSLTGQFDQNNYGTALTAQQFNASYTVAANGRGTLSSSTLPPMVFYMISSNRAFIMQSSSDEEQIGMIEQAQTATFNNGSFTGTFRLGPIAMALPGSSLSQGVLIADGSGTFTATEDVNDQGLSQQAFSGTYTVASSGRTQINVTSPVPFHYVAYPVSSSRFVGLSIQTNDYAALLASLDQ